MFHLRDCLCGFSREGTESISCEGDLRLGTVRNIRSSLSAGTTAGFHTKDSIQASVLAEKGHHKMTNNRQTNVHFMFAFYVEKIHY